MAYKGIQYGAGPSGLLQSPLGASGGRTDTLPYAVAANSYVIPADVVSGLGEGDTYSGAQLIEAMLRSLPYGIAHIATGGKAHGGGQVPVVVANGEYILSPEQVAAIGGGDIGRGHKVLHKFVEMVRNRTIKDLKHLPGPVK